MAVSDSDAIVLVNRYFRNPVFNEKLRKYQFQIVGVSRDSIRGVRQELFRKGSTITLEEIYDFIDCNYPDEYQDFPTLNLKYLMPGESLIITHKTPDNKFYRDKLLKLSSSEYLYCSDSDGVEDNRRLITLPAETILIQNSESPITDGLIVSSVQIIVPSKNYRLLDKVLLRENYFDSASANIKSLYTFLSKSHFYRKVSSGWPEVISLASNAGISIHSVFKLLEYISHNE